MKEVKMGKKLKKEMSTVLTLTCCCREPRANSNSVDKNGDSSPGNSYCDREEVSLLSESPYRIFKVAERGEVGEFRAIIEKDKRKVYARDNSGKTPIHHAAAGNCVNILEVIVENDGDVNYASDYKGNSALHLAVEANSADAVEFLLRHKANLRHLNGRLQTPLHLAAILNKPECLAVMAKFVKSSDVDQVDEHGRTALHLACMYDHEECVKILLEDLKACPKRICAHQFYPIHEAAKHGASRSLGALLTLGAANGCPREEMILFHDAEGNVPLHSAVHGGDIQTVKLCLLSGAKISIQQQDLSTAVHLACSQGALEIVKLMFTIQPEEKQMVLGTADLERMTPLHCAAMYDHAELVEYLITEGANLDAVDKRKNSPLQLAATRRAWGAAKVLLNHGANTQLEDENGRSFLHALVKYDGKFSEVFEEDAEVKKVVSVGLKDKNGWTALHLAGKYGNVEVFSKLLSLGADIFVENGDGENVFHIACRYGRLEILEKILQLENCNNAIINEGNGNGLTPFHIAAFAGHCDVLRLLMKKGAVLHRDYDGCTPLHLAAQRGHTDAMKLILSTHSHLLDHVDKVGNTALHIAARYNQPRAVSLLLKLDCKLSYNDAGFSAIDYALQKKFVDVVYLMVTDSKRGSDVLSLTGGKHPVVMKALIAKLPNVAKAVLDQNIVPSDAKQDSKKFNIKYDFKWFSLPKEDPDSRSGSTKPRSRRTKLRPEKIFLPILNEMVLHKRVDLLSHDLSQKYLEMKWNGIGKYFQIFNLLLYCLYLALVTHYAISPWNKDDHFFATWNDLHGFNSTHHNGHESELVHEQIKSVLASNDTILPMAPTNDVAQQEIDFFNYLRYYYQETDMEDIGDLFKFAVVFNRVAPLIFTFSVSMMLLECVSLWRYGLQHCFNFDTWAWYGVNAANFVMCLSQGLPGREMVNPSAALAVFLSWFYLLLILQRFDLVGIYVSMFLEILRSLVRVLLIFSVLIIGFGLTFYILLSNGNHLVFTDIPLSIMRTFSMMLGDLDFMNTFGFPHHCQLLEAMNMTHIKMYSKLTECKSSRRLPYPFMSFTMIGLYMLLNCILLVNLLIGLAVGDIDTVKRNAQLKRLAMQVQMQTNLERTIPATLLRRFEKPHVVIFPNVQQKQLNLMEKIVEFFHPKSPPSDDTKELVEYSSEILDSLGDTADSIDSLRKEVAAMKSWMNCMNLNLQKISTALNVSHSEIESRTLSVSTPRKLRRSSTKVVLKKPRVSVDVGSSSDSE